MPTIEGNEENRPHPQKRLEQKGHRLAPPVKAWLYDCEDRSLTLHERNELESRFLHVLYFGLSILMLAEKEEYGKIKLGKSQKEIALFVNAESEEVSTDQKSNEGLNEPLAILTLDRAGVWNNFLRVIGNVPTLYIAKSSSSDGVMSFCCSG